MGKTSRRQLLELSQTEKWEALTSLNAILSVTRWLQKSIRILPISVFAHVGALTRVEIEECSLIFGGEG